MSLLLSKIFGSGEARFKKEIVAINTLESSLQDLSLEDLRHYSEELRKKIQNQEKNEEDILPEAFALVREASRRTLGQRHFDVQLMGGIVMHQGKIAEMATGEGKTLAATLPAYLNALAGRGVHIVTVNDYLARRDTVWMGQIYHVLGLKVACLTHNNAFWYDVSYTQEQNSVLDRERDTLGAFKVFHEFLRPVSRKEAYHADIIYGTNHEFGFDYLRDNLSLDLDERVQNGHYFAIIDEVDSILIDEARTPLIIAAPDRQASDFYKIFAVIVDQLVEGKDYLIDEKLKSAVLTENGIERAEKMLNVNNLYSLENLRLTHFLQTSLRAKALFKRDRDYVVKDGEVIIVDEFTGRLLPGRRFSGGLHQAIEAREKYIFHQNITVKEENRIYAQITLQNYFRLYKKIAGMTGTAQTSAEEFHKVYGLEVVTIPTNKPMIRRDLPDVIYKTKAAKYQAVVEEVKKRHITGQPILIGTTSITNNEIISAYLTEAGIKHEILNAKNHEREGEIIAQAGRPGAVTVATNMAGRGVDIILGGNPPDPVEAVRVREVGGLHVIGTERHEARRIDNQLRGRSGRQGDPGSSQFFLSLEDDLLRIFGGEKIKKIIETLNLPEDMPLEANLISKAISQAQQKVEGMNFDLRRHLLDFDDVLNKQRTAIYVKRENLLQAGKQKKLKPIIEEILIRYENDLKANETKLNESANEEEKKRFQIALENLARVKQKINDFSEENEALRSKIISQQLVRIIDILWMDHLENLEYLRESVNLRAYGQHEPLVEYRREAHWLFQRLNNVFEQIVVDNLNQWLEQDLNNVLIENQQKAAVPPLPKKIGRNDPCWCNSGKKFKKCHGQ